MPESKQSRDAEPKLDEFLNEAQAFLSSVLDGIQKAIGDHEDAPLIKSHSDAVRQQFGNLSGDLKTRYERGSTESRRNVDELMKVQAVTSLASNGRNTFSTSVESGVFGDGAFSWIESIMEEIKKLIDMIFEQFGGKPKWLDAIMQIIDQILKAIISLFGGALGRSRSRVASDLSKMEVEFWNEIGARRRANAGFNGDDDDDDD